MSKEFRKAIFVPTDMQMDHNPLWAMKGDCAFPSATQNEITPKDAENLINNGVKVVAEGVNMPYTYRNPPVFRERRPLRTAKAANCGGVAVSGLEMAEQPAHRLDS